MVKSSSYSNGDTLSSFWTGKPPIVGVCPGVDANGIIRSLPQVNVNGTRKELVDYFDNSWTLTEVLFNGLNGDNAYYKRPYHQLRHPMIFYYAHPAVFYINKLRVAGLIDEPTNPTFEKIFETGVDEMRWDDLHEGSGDLWPSVDDVRQYRSNVYRIVRTAIETHPSFDHKQMPMTMDKPSWALLMSFEHERIHFETSSVLIRELPIELVRVPVAWPSLIVNHTDKQSIKNPMIKMEEAVVPIGKPVEWPTYGWDNEYGSESRVVRPFSASAMLISNAQFYDFVTGNGYTQERYWSLEGWAWRSFRNTKAPAFWVQVGPAGLHQYKLRTIFEVIEMQWDFPVCVNFHEAKAYCAWRTEHDNSFMPYRLLTEAEHNVLRDGKEYPWNNNLRYGSEMGVCHTNANEKGFFDVFGNVWQWCEDHFHPLKGGTPHRYYEDFSVPCYDGQHHIILGGSFISTGDESSIWARFHFRPHFLQHVGFRIVRNDDGNSDCDAQRIDNTVTYETEEMLNNYLMMHWGEKNERFDLSLASKVIFPQVVDLPIACFQLVQRFTTGTDRVLDLGCAVGRAAFELARHFKEVIGIDYSRKFIDAARHLQQYGTLDYYRKDQGMQGTSLKAIVDPSIDRTRIRFSVGDACALPLHLKEFDAVVFANVLCRLPDPAACLQRMQGINGLVKPGGILVMTTPFSWLLNYTPLNKWLNSVDDIANVLNDFDLIYQEELPFIIREHRRKYEYIITLATVWKRRLSQN
jgi:5-histidylcysteine sulfoxide synthase/putative 4-mercaptohistidine N1-methyltranferase